MKDIDIALNHPCGTAQHLNLKERITPHFKEEKLFEFESVPCLINGPHLIE